MGEVDHSFVASILTETKVAEILTSVAQARHFGIDRIRAVLDGMDKVLAEYEIDE